MPEISNSQNLNSYYSSETKTQRPDRLIVSGPQNIPVSHLFNDRDANNRLKAINDDIYMSYKEEERKEKKNFIKTFGAIVAVILAFLGIKHIFK